MSRYVASTVTKRGWESAVTARPARNSANDSYFSSEKYGSLRSSKVWNILYDGKQVGRWKIVLCEKGLFVVDGIKIMSRPYGSGRPGTIAREYVINSPKFWREVIRQHFAGHDPQCETCAMRSPVPHFPANLDHRIHCTCDHCF